MFDPPGMPAPEHIRHDNLGTNRNGVTIKALAIDSMFLCPPGLETFNVKPRTHHKQKFADILFSDGHAVSRPNRAGKFSVDVRDYAEVRQAFDKILQVLEKADDES